MVMSNINKQKYISFNFYIVIDYWNIFNFSIYFIAC
jgi:hypothetical protein